MRSNEEVERAINRYSDTVYRVCFLYLKNESETEDIFQEVFLKYALSSCTFESEKHEKSWIIRVAVNGCKDFLKSFFRSKSVPLDSAKELPVNDSPKISDTLRAVLSLPKKYKDVIYLHYYEGYTADEIGKIIDKNKNTVYTLLSRGRKILEKELGGNIDE